MDPRTAIYTHGDGGAFAYAGQLCRCSNCGLVQRCTPTFDFYTTDDERIGPLVCEPCLARVVKAAGIVNLNLNEVNATLN